MRMLSSRSRNTLFALGKKQRCCACNGAIDVHVNHNEIGKQQQQRCWHGTFQSPKAHHHDEYGTIEGVWVFSRHGDRAPCRAICSKKDEDAAFWMSKLGSSSSHDPTAPSIALEEDYPPDIHPSNESQFLDIHRQPYGYLTTLGMDQLKTNGKRFFTRYNQHHHHGHLEQLQQQKKESFLDSWNVEVYSTNFLRTVLSAQCFLDGLLGTTTTTKDQQHLSALSNDDSVPVQVRARHEDTLNAFDRNPEEMDRLVANVVESADFCQKDERAVPLARDLVKHFPGLGSGAKTYGGPTGINWINANDHFVCRTAHDVPFLKFTHHDDDDDDNNNILEMEQQFRHVAHSTITHLAWRFRQWYQSPPLLAAIAGPPLRDVVNQIQATPALGHTERHPFVVYSCHDVTILSLLYALGADFLAHDDADDWKFWPSYATTLVFELVRIRKEIGQDSHIVRILLNGTPLKLVNLLEQQNTDDSQLEYIGSGPKKMLRISDLNQIVTQLENVGGVFREPVVADADVERDMSKWTG